MNCNVCFGIVILILSGCLTHQGAATSDPIDAVLNVARSNGWVAALNGETSDPIEYCYSFRKILHECIDKGVDAGDVFARAGVHSLPFVESEIPFCPEDSDSE